MCFACSFQYLLFCFIHATDTGTCCSVCRALLAAMLAYCSNLSQLCAWLNGNLALPSGLSCVICAEYATYTLMGTHLTAEPQPPLQNEAFSLARLRAHSQSTHMYCGCTSGLSLSTHIPPTFSISSLYCSTSWRVDSLQDVNFLPPTLQTF